MRMTLHNLSAVMTLLCMMLAACGGSGSAGQAETSKAPQITAQPSSQTVAVGQTAIFSVAATGSAPLAYQWSKDGSSITGATASSYTTPAAQLSDTGASFTVVVSNAAGEASSNAAKLTVAAAGAGTDVVTYKYDVMRTGQNLTERTLTPANVAAASFGLLRNLEVDGLVDAQPLYLSGLTVSGASHNVVFVATEHDSVYAFDADTGTQLWRVSLIGSGESTSDDHVCNQITPEIGVTSTPAIDRSAGPHGTIYLVAMTKDASANYHQRLHALDVTSGAELAGSPTELAGTFKSTSFDPRQYAERAALLLVNKTLWLSFTSHCDEAPYGGWVMSVSESSLAVTGVINLANGASGTGFASQGPSIWMSGGGPAADAEGYVYVLTGNGKFDALNPGGFPTYGDYGNSFVKMALAGGALTVSDYFAMDNELSESQNDLDLGAGGIMLLPDQTDAGGAVRHLAVGAGKDGNLYVVNRDNMGKFKSSSNAIWQEIDGALLNGVWSTPAYYNSNVYYGPKGSPLLMFPIAQAMLAATPSSHSGTQFTYPGTFPVISANGATNGIVWAYENTSPAVLHAYSAANLAKELYNSNQAAAGRDQVGAGNKFIVPIVADGKVLVATTSGVAVFGLLP
jgi:outer membrane protein assembly factor BamB